MVINPDEMEALRGLSWIPQLIYFRVLRANMDFESGFSGMPTSPTKLITYQLIRDEVEPKSVPGKASSNGISDRSIRNAFKNLTKAGLINEVLPQPEIDGCFAFECLLADTNQKRALSR